MPWKASSKMMLERPRNIYKDGYTRAYRRDHGIPLFEYKEGDMSRRTIGSGRKERSPRSNR